MCDRRDAGAMSGEEGFRTASTCSFCAESASSTPREPGSKPALGQVGPISSRLCSGSSAKAKMPPAHAWVLVKAPISPNSHKSAISYTWRLAEIARPAQELWCNRVQRVIRSTEPWRSGPHRPASNNCENRTRRSSGDAPLRQEVPP